MKFLNTKLKKTFFWIIITLITLAVVIVACISPIAKYLVEKYDVKYFGREVTLDWAYVNPFTGYVHIHNLNIYEYKSNNVFFSTKSISTNLEMHKLLSKTYEISELTIDEPVANIIQDKKVLNFSDLIDKFSSKDSLHKKKKEPVHFNILNIRINNGTFYYHERSIPVNYYVKKVNVETSGKMWNADTIAARFSLESGLGSGTIKGSTVVNINSLDYRFKALVNKFDLSVLEQYLKDIANYGSLRANLDADLDASGNFKKSEELNAKGLVSINDFHFGKSKTEDYAAFDKFTISIRQLSPANKKYMFDSVSLVHPYLKYERYDHLDNLQNMFGKKGQKVKQADAEHHEVNILFQIADYVKLLAKNFFRSNYKIQKLGIYNANLKYNDYTLTEKFAVSASPLTILADSIDRSNNKWVGVTLNTGLKPYGDFEFALSINPQDSSDFNLQYHLQRVPAALFNPFLITYTSFPLDRGTIELKGAWKVNNGVIGSNNHILVIDPRINKKQKRNGAKWVPLKFIMFFVRDRGNVIDFEVPINGNLKDPKFKLHEAILQVVENIFVKPATTPYRIEVKNIETDIEKSLALKWDMRSSSLQSDQDAFMEKVAGHLRDNPSTTITVHSIWYADKEKEYILFFEAKKMFYLSYNKIGKNELTDYGTSSIDRISVKDSAFIRYLNHKLGNGKDMLFTVQDKCMKLVGQNVVNEKYQKLIGDRQKVFMAYFKSQGVESRVKMEGDLNKIPYNGFSLYKIDYKGGIPPDLLEDYRRLKDLDNESPRSKFKRLREKYRNEIRNRK